ncbi:substrate-binding periplasmic protein [Rheinheimera texasensis]|uniref:substrate-binding periplasmic protein n=1 Tax=Rheinheimera texasensis TaxID=306205 RepID=UPI00068B43A8|nr:transporter substrate-binding domain-containing protein [Rheinheimera texasensis]
MLLSSAVQAADDRPVLHWCLDHFPRFHEFQRPDRPVGASVDLMQELARRAGFRIEYSPRTPVARCFRQIASGEADLMTNLNKTPEREALMLMFPYSERIPESLYQRGDDPRTINQLSQLEHLTLATVRNYAYHPDLMTLVRNLGSNRQLEVPSIAAGFDVLAKGRVDGLIVPRYSSLDYLYNTPRLHQKFKRAPLMLKTATPQFIYIGFSRHSRHPQLAAVIEKTIAEMMADGTVSRLYAPDASQADLSVLVGN